jgi:CheY-like chemotaxis protein
MAKVLVVDDSLSVRKVVEKALGGRDVEVLSAATAGEAIERIERDRPDLVVCDVILPDKDGYEVCEYIRAHPALGRIPVLLISGVVNSTVLARAAEVQSSDVMFKPFAADELVRKIDGLLNGRMANGAPIGARPAARSVDQAAPARGLAAPRGVQAVPAGRGPTPDRGEMAGAARGPAPATNLSAVEHGPASVGPAREPTSDLQARLAALAATPGVRMAALADLEGFLLESAGEQTGEADAASALAAALRASSEDVGYDLGQGALLGMILEYEQGLLLLHRVGAGALLTILVGDAAALGKVRYVVKKAVPELERAL